MRVLIIDNYDSFVYNLARYCNELACSTLVVRNDKIKLSEIKKANFSHIILSPGPCTPKESGICLDIIKNLYQSIPILGVCLGHQAIAYAFGGKVVRAKYPMHGMKEEIINNQKDVFQDLAKNINVARYHSLIVDNESLPKCLEVSAWSKEHEIMAIKHKTAPCFGVQFHPESVLSEDGKIMLKNFLSYQLPDLTL